MQFDKTELSNLIALVNKAPVTGLESTTVALLLQKLATMLQAAQAQEVTPTVETTTE